MSTRNALLAAVVLFGIFAGAPAQGMQCEMLYSGGPPPELASQWACLGDPAIRTPISFWTKNGMGITWPNQNSHGPAPFVVCKYTLIFLWPRYVTWQTFDSAGNPYPVDRCDFYCLGTRI